ncbi:MAG TPA: hypothetical protein VKQ08_05865, partial [Cyclobacteriaceae bacterium]|nr:hypothetical protein [Cyclobacteriaceae bacterium]
IESWLWVDSDGSKAELTIQYKGPAVRYTIHNYFITKLTAGLVQIASRKAFLAKARASEYGKN